MATSSQAAFSTPTGKPTLTSSRGPTSSTLISPPPPVIPTSWLAPHEQRWAFVSIFGLIEVTKIWDIIAPYLITNPEPTWSSALRIEGPLSATLWTLFELSTFFGISLLRIPLLSPSTTQLVKIAALLILWNLACWLIAEPGAFLLRLNLFGPPALGVQWYLSWWPIVSRAVLGEPSHLGGVHHIRLLPHSTATLNPLSVTYCIPPNSNIQPLYIPIVFNNSVPTEVSYFIRSLENEHSTIQTVAGTSLHKSQDHKPSLQITDFDEDSDETDNPASALILRSQQLDVSKLPSIKPADSLAFIPHDLEPSQQILFLSVSEPSIVSLKQAVDRRGDRFHITPHREAVIIECPTGGQFVDHHDGRIIKKGEKSRPAETRCVNDQEVVHFQARGVGELKVNWKKKSKDGIETGVIEGIDSEVQAVDELALARREKMSRTHTVPLRVSHDKSGVHTISLTSVTDSMRNTYIPSGPSTEKVFNVIPRPSASFACPGPIQLLINMTAAFFVQLDGTGPLPSPMDITYTFQPLAGEEKRTTMHLNKRSEAITVVEPGTYTLLDISGQCAGSVLEPSTCRVELVPPPALAIKVESLHEGAMDIGVLANFDFTGTAPFTVFWTEQRKGSRAVSHSKRFDSHHGDIVLQPEQEGMYTYTFKALSDRHYQHIPLDEPPIQQTVHPLANVGIVGQRDGIRKIKVFSCSGDQVDLALEAKGTAPLKLSYLKSWDGKSENATIDIKSGRSVVPITIPSEYGPDSNAVGKMTVVLTTIEDGDGRIRKLPAPTLEVDINRQKPTVRFVKSEKVVITEGDSVKAALRLAGESPWEVTYSINGRSARPITLRDANNHLVFTEAGVYRLEHVKDAHCSGHVVTEESTFEITYKPRPVVALVDNPSLKYEFGVYKHKGFCAGGEDHISIKFTGEAPYELAYRYTVEGRTTRHTLKSAQESGVLHLAIEPGHHRYDFISLGDSNYPTSPISHAVEHDVHSQPSVTFIRPNSIPICLDTSLKGDAKVRLQGKAPFTINLTVRKPASTQLFTHTVMVKTNEWTLDVPYVVKDIGRHEVSIISVTDDSGCAQIVNDDDRLSTVVEVVESARIVPVTALEDLCEGDNLDFLLQGKAPWTIEYSWLGKKHKVSSSASRFSRYAESPGIFQVHSVALKDNQCKREIVDLIRRIHPLPSVKIQEGLDHLREGDEPAVFGVTFEGTSPFSFTYTRSEIINGKKKVVETQTITDIHDNNYIISSSAPGDYEVTSVSDKWCRYPPLSTRQDV
ncbi:hypothetical protein TREMEDRAFT_71756 [Tremella mesenterica DSM 1558]|uniref:uncharacterized protein n=1 Tax=Tremella mesenterica (strain ATCC 24925 / CBS 8224 / DSM 1558 / NBRC 9311 / NRRL Y-6157 / RJB 2259-6 / UBC 559-6) TaxID=578456 RepID=UPI0003F48E10|nr:uncharacterized protein TREMEDRAFT_71756 [Tremella mesenterica DSM 1558]EIW69014.1 hypothetical protein TREMEDRAFT_71756 [Tremella mesenterica DSM 1558]